MANNVRDDTSRRASVLRRKAEGFAHEPVVPELHQCGIAFQYRVRGAARLQYPGADFKVVGAQHQDGIVQFPGHLQRPPLRTGGMDAGEILRLRVVQVPKR